MRRLYLGNGDNEFKFADTTTEIHLNASNDISPANLTSNAKVRIKNDSGYLMDANATVDGSQAVITSGQLAQLPPGSYLLELWDTTTDGGTAIYPSDGFLAIQINENVASLSGKIISSMTVDDFVHKFDDLSQQLKKQVSDAISNGLNGDKGDKGDAFTKLNYEARNASDELEDSIIPYSKWALEGLTKGEFNNRTINRVASSNLISFEKPVVLYADDENIKFGVHIFKDGAFVKDSGWITPSSTKLSYIIPANTQFKLTVAYEPETDKALTYDEAMSILTHIRFVNLSVPEIRNQMGITAHLSFVGKGSTRHEYYLPLEVGKTYRIHPLQKEWNVSGLSGNAYAIAKEKNGVRQPDLYKIPISNSLMNEPAQDLIITVGSGETYVVSVRAVEGVTVGVDVISMDSRYNIANSLSRNERIGNYIATDDFYGKDDVFNRLYLQLEAGKEYIVDFSNYDIPCKNVAVGHNTLSIGYYPKGSDMTDQRSAKDIITIKKNSADLEKTQLKPYRFVAEDNEFYYLQLRNDKGSYTAIYVGEYENKGIITRLSESVNRIDKISNKEYHSYTGEILPFAHKYDLDLIGDFTPNDTTQSCQGFDYVDGYLLSAQSTGIATLYTLSSDFELKKVGGFNLASKADTNHANVLSFGNERVNTSDVLPVIYITQCYPQTVNGVKDACYVERVDVNGLTSELVQTIIFDDKNHRFGYALNWVVDKENNLLVGFGNSISNGGSGNKHPLIVFKLPKLSDGATVTLTEEDAVEFYIMDDLDYTLPHNFVTQGAVVVGRRLILPTGFGNVDNPSIIFVWNMATKRLDNVINMQSFLPVELEDASLCGNALLVGTQKNIYALTHRYL